VTRLLLVAALTASGCAFADIGPEGEAGLEDIEFQADNGIFLDNGLNLANGMNLGNGTILHNGMNLGNGVDLANGMNLGNGIYAPPAGSGLEQWIDVEPAMRKKILRYLVECALPAGAEVSLTYRGQSESFRGIAGLGPSLRAGLMTEDDQQRVTACMLARVNGTGQTVQINMFGPMGAGSGFETDGVGDAPFTVLEAAFYGNLFAATPRAFACQEEGYSLADMRSCRDAGGGEADCGVIDFAYVPCSGYIGDPRMCGEAFTGGNGWQYYEDCWAGGMSWHYVLTTYLRPRKEGEVCSTDEECASGWCAGVCEPAP
jgi:hypothetical protein